MQKLIYFTLFTSISSFAATPGHYAFATCDPTKPQNSTCGNSPTAAQGYGSMYYCQQLNGITGGVCIPNYYKGQQFQNKTLKSYNPSIFKPCATNLLGTCGGVSMHCYPYPTADAKTGICLQNYIG